MGSMHVSVCICTRDRGGLIRRTLDSVLASTHQDHDLVIVDQSSGDETSRVVEAYLTTGKVLYLRSHATGVSRARNLALQNAAGPIVAMTDDDCEVDPDWLERIVRHFGANPDVGQVQGDVEGPQNLEGGFAIDARIHSFRRISSPWLKWADLGIGANRAFRKDVLAAVGPFDEILGPGAPLFASEDGDMTYRVLRAGYDVVNAPDVHVIHHAVRGGRDGQLFMRRVSFGVAAAYMKHVRMGDVAVVPTLLYECFRCIQWRRLITLRKPFGLARFAFFLYGIRASFRYPIDSRRRVYLAP